MITAFEAGIAQYRITRHACVRVHVITDGKVLYYQASRPLRFISQHLTSYNI